MMLYGHDQRIAQWVAHRLGIAGWDEKARAIGIIRRGDLVAGVVFSDYRHPNIAMSIASTSPIWASRDTIGEIFRYPFIQLGCKRVTALTEATNQRSRAFLCRLGFNQEGIHPDLFPSGDGVTYGLLRREAERWLTEEDRDARQCLSA